jgi:hypothetical protein
MAFVKDGTGPNAAWTNGSTYIGIAPVIWMLDQTDVIVGQVDWFVKPAIGKVSLNTDGFDAWIKSIFGVGIQNYTFFECLPTNRTKHPPLVAI